MSNSRGTTTLVRSTNIMQDPTKIAKSALVKSFFNVKIGSNLHRFFFSSEKLARGTGLIIEFC